MHYKLTYKATLLTDGTETTEEITCIFPNKEFALASAFDLANGDWGDLIAYDIQLAPTHELPS